MHKWVNFFSRARLHHGSHWCSCHAVVFPTKSPAKHWECHAARTLPVTCVYLVACISHICDYECVTPTGNTHDHAGPCFITNAGFSHHSPYLPPCPSEVPTQPHSIRRKRGQGPYQQLKWFSSYFEGICTLHFTWYTESFPNRRGVKTF